MIISMHRNHFCKGSRVMTWAHQRPYRKRTPQNVSVCTYVIESPISSAKVALYIEVGDASLVLIRN
ncbi:hypothetical protein M413DRAFT_387179 [Hebeloma cylindrosporum]|uniref:Uncharacterized protein n=1 Tax=Hebeloma cylindrosporum TaxID=76867 RepID=A0A0C3CJ28_HEBCY|nr:hypothetical protein M413DRAFT_387179 [Hebeloma cylindrosporum h7]